MDAVRSTWEESIEEYIKGKYSALRIESNNRSIIPSRSSRSASLEIDIFIPQLCLGIEANGTPYHDREKYLNDRAYGTADSDEMYKEDYCRSVGIELVHVWSSEDAETIQLKIDNAIQRRLADPAIREWHEGRESALPGFVQVLLAMFQLLAFYLGGALAFAGFLGTSFALMGAFGGVPDIFFTDALLLPSFFTGTIGLYLAVLADPSAAESPRATLTSRHLDFANYLGYYISSALIFVGATAIIPGLLAVFGGYSFSELFVPLARLASAGAIGLILKRFLDHSDR